MEQLNTKAVIANIQGLMKKSTLNIIAIGNELNAVKLQADNMVDANAKIIAKAEFQVMINSELPFGHKVAQKFMKIAKDALVNKYADFIPPSYNAIYENLLGKSDEFFKNMTTSHNLTNDTGNTLVMNTYLGKGGEKINLPTDEIYVLNPFATGKQIASLSKLVKNKMEGVPEVKPEEPAVIDNTPKTKVEKEGVTSINIKSDNQVKAEMTEEEEKTSAYIKALGEDKETKNNNVLPISDAKDTLPVKSSSSEKSATKKEDVPTFVNIVNVEIDTKNFPESKIAELSILMASIKSMVTDFGKDNGVSNTIKVDADTKVLQFTKLAS